MKRKPIIVVTGGIASGKSTVAEVLAGTGGAHLEADKLAHKALEVEEVIESIKRAYGDGAISSEGGVSRDALAAEALSSPERMEKLNSIVGPEVRSIINSAVRNASLKHDYIVLDAVLFFKYKFDFRVDKVISTEASESIRTERLMKRDSLSREEAELRVISQRYLYPGWKRCDITIDTEKDIEKLKREVISIRESLIEELAGPGPGGKNG